MGTDFYAVLDQVLALLHSRGRVTYKALRLQFNLDDAHLAVLKEELLYAHPQVVDDAGRGLIWPRDERLLAPQRVAHSAMLRFYEDLVSALLQREGRVSYRTLTQLFGFDAACLEHVRQELCVQTARPRCRRREVSRMDEEPAGRCPDQQPSHRVDCRNG